MEDDSADILLEHGAVIISTGARGSLPDEYLYGRDKRVLTHLDLDPLLSQGTDLIKKSNITSGIVQALVKKEVFELETRISEFRKYIYETEESLKNLKIKLI